MFVRKSILPELLLVTSFVAFYASVEFLLGYGAARVGELGLGTFVLFLISFLNLIPAGVFAFTVVSLLPKQYASDYNENTLLVNEVGNRNPRVAILYTTFNDFMIEHAEYDVAEASKARMPFFVLDDSTDISKKNQIDSFASANGCEVFRRNNRKGYKAGAINEWIRCCGYRFDYFFVLDSDSRAGSEAIRYCIELAKRDRKIAIVQSKTLTMTSNPTRLTSSGVTVQHAYMEVVQKAMKNLGTTPYYGHNALIAVRPLMTVGGFVDESNEDYKTLAKLQDRGYRAIYAEEAETWEEVPPDYFSTRKRSLRWSRDAVTQLSLLKYKVPLANFVFLVYGWVTYMSNLVLLLLFFSLTVRSFSQVIGNGFAEMAGLATISVILFWPLISARVKDSELSLPKLMRALFWGSVYNIPMMAPITIQMTKTAAAKSWKKIAKLFGVQRKIVEEFVVTPKTAVRDESLGSIVSKLRAEIFVGLLPFFLAIMSSYGWSLLYSLPQIISGFGLPLLVYSESQLVRNRYLQGTQKYQVRRFVAHKPYYIHTPGSSVPIPQRLELLVR